MCANRAPKKHTRMTSTMVRKAWRSLGVRERERRLVSTLSSFRTSAGSS